MSDGAGDDGVRDEGVYVVALVGESPGVVTELLWHLAVCERRRIRGVELWTTQRGCRALKGVGAALYEALGREVEHLPTWPHPLQPKDPAEPRVDGAVQMFVPGGELGDVRSLEEARLFSTTLHRRIRLLADEAVRPQLIGALAGGRKTMAAALHSAFSLHARGSDRLCHVLLEEAVEETLRREKRLGEYAFPTETIAGVPPREQLSVFDIPFFPVPDFRERGPGARAPAQVGAARDQHARGARGLAGRAVRHRPVRAERS